MCWLFWGWINEITLGLNSFQSKRGHAFFHWLPKISMPIDWLTFYHMPFYTTVLKQTWLFTHMPFYTTASKQPKSLKEGIKRYIIQVHFRLMISIQHCLELMVDLDQKLSPQFFLRFFFCQIFSIIDRKVYFSFAETWSY